MSGERGGIFVSKGDKKPHVKGIITFVGDGVREDIEVGDLVIYARYSGEPIDWPEGEPDKEYLLLNERDIWVRVEGNDEG